MKKNKEWLAIIVGVSTLIFGIIPIVGNSFKALSNIRLRRLGDTTTAALITEYKESNVWLLCCIFLLTGGYYLLQKAKRNPMLFLWSLIVAILVYLILTAYFIQQDFPGPSMRSDLLAEVMWITFYAILFPVIGDFVITSISRRKYDQRFWVITLPHSAIYLVVWPAMIGDVITILNVGSN
ncbi:hypothetical protein [Chitinophaga nivalis]|uniref:Uncharacterized protein n=1 Tax=Chitinophaga nivalis TaxID=2991709 RepID=A0ABT3IJN8_9BACT|nr:hypothetical protein [Chitinophaga nivalis]MCW3466150.1 hypothetical protein [Chitinophaga nivalis]MCW3484159.1 hypothetical protein [Chitinophaga nivalis]